jgi:hypothetical protein
MNPEFAPRIIWGVALLVFVVVVVVSGFQKRRRGGRHRSGPGPGASGAIYDLLNEDKRNAVEVIVEERAGARDPEDADGNLPDLEKPKRPS